AEVAVQIATEPGSLSVFNVRRADGLVHVRCDTQLPISARKEKEVQISAGDVKRIVVVIARPRISKLRHFLRLEPSIGVEAIIAVEDGANPELILEVISVILPRRLHIVHLLCDRLVLLLELGRALLDRTLDLLIRSCLNFLLYLLLQSIRVLCCYGQRDAPGTRAHENLSGFLVDPELHAATLCCRGSHADRCSYDRD